MVTPESRVKDHLRRRIKRLGGDYRFIRYVGRNDCPDVLVMLSGIPPTLVETKGSEGDARDSQKREHERLRKAGFRVLVLPTKEDIDREFPEATP